MGNTSLMPQTNKNFKFFLLKVTCVKIPEPNDLTKCLDLKVGEIFEIISHHFYDRFSLSWMNYTRRKATRCNGKSQLVGSNLRRTSRKGHKSGGDLT